MITAARRSRPIGRNWTRSGILFENPGDAAKVVGELLGFVAGEGAVEKIGLG
jgi:hypothetical protein